ncbi:(R)-specific enoyl-CoA hydratase [Sinobacterium norvegicum]|uniref:(R)-specific enoyl-CoA hydratase n=1 Tax=Sinobacterium norvegicum TaxID=1641715 RepID=A0ABN8EDK4_9GAMM|nr:MaoC/PaaZ C-terminal domain-containing protein [Sinobacterium norvegicum]CAH0990524.1 (R)-specific enoyl-CoA hydratase [Sinobacterium norvegicum]
MTTLENVTFDEISIGQSASYTKPVTEKDILLFAAVSGDVNPVHLDAEFAASTMFGERIAHGMFTGALVSAALALELPGPGCIYLGQNLSFRAPVLIGDTITVNLEVTAKRDDRKYVTLKCVAVNQHGKKVATGEANVIAPTEKLVITAPQLPEVTVG